MSAPRFRPTGVEHEYQVTLDGVDLGIVRKRSEHFNLRRPITVHSWTAITTGGKRLRPPFTRSGYNTRKDAVAALVEAARA